jgi:hypothetical protein
MNLSEVTKPEVKKTVVIYSGRFQPFHKGHYAAYQKLVSKFGADNVYIGTSDKIDGGKSPFNFNDKKKIATTMFGVPASKFVQVKNPYSPVEILSKYDGKTTQYIAAVGEKDATRLAGKYFKPYNGKAGYGYDEIGYTYTIPSESNPISGTDVRKGLGNDDETKAKEFFLKAYPKFDKGIYKMITAKLNEAFPGGIGVGLDLPNGYINGAPTGSVDESNNTSPSYEMRPEPHPTRHETEHPTDEPDWHKKNEPYDPISEILHSVVTEEAFNEWLIGYLGEAPNPIMDKEISYTAADGKKKNITVRGALRLPKEHPAHIQAAKIMGPADAPANEPSKKEPQKPNQPGQPVKKGDTVQGKADAAPKGGNQQNQQQAPPPEQKLSGAELKSSAEMSPDEKKAEHMKQAVDSARKELSDEDNQMIDKVNNPQSSERKGMMGNIKSGLQKFGKGLQHWAHHKKEMVGGTMDAVKALASGQKIGSTKNKETGKWEYSDEKRKEQIDHMKHFAIDAGLIMGSMALGGAGVAAAKAVMGGKAATAATAALHGATGAFTHGAVGFGTHLIKDIAKHASLEALGLGASKAAGAGAVLSTATMGLLEGIDTNNESNKFITNFIKKVVSTMDSYKLSDEQLLKSIESYKKEQPKQNAADLLKEEISESKKNSINDFVEYATKRLKLKERPKVTLISGNQYSESQSSLGGYSPETKEIYVQIENRLGADILRTIAHEMVHRKQDEMGLIGNPMEAGKDGSPVENQAHAVAGILMREYGRRNRQIYTEVHQSSTYRADNDSEEDFMKHHKNSLGAPDMGYPAELDTYDNDDNRKLVPGYQTNTKDDEDFGYEPVKEKLSQSNLNSVEKYADRELSPADIEFSNHFFDRVNDPRNGKEISEPELTGFFKRLASHHKKEFLQLLDKYNQIVVKDTRSDINIPFVKMANKVIAKTVMRKGDFQTSSHTIVNEAQAVSGGKVHKFITGKNLGFKGKKYSEIEFETLGIDNRNQIVRLKIIAPKEIGGNEMSLDFRTIRRGPFFKTDTSSHSIHREDVNVDVDKGDEVLMGKFKNKKVTVKDIGIDSHGMPTINGKQATTFRTTDEALLMEGGAYGHMNHPFDISMNLTFGDLKKIINNALDGKLGVVREKTDGQALAISWKNGRLIAARNKSHLANGGANALDANGLASKFGGRGALSDAYNFAMKDLTAAISSLGEAERKSIFKDGSAFCNLEVIYPQNANVIPYGQNLLVFHNVVEYDEKGNAIGGVKGAESKLASMIKKVNADVQSKYTIQGPPITKLPKDEKLSSQKGKFGGMLSRLQSEFGLSDKDGVAEYHYAWWMNFVNKSKKNLSQLEKEGLARRWAFDNKSFTIKSITDEDARKWADGVDKDAKDKIMKGNLRKFEDIFLGVGAEVLSFMSSVLTAQPDKALQSIKASLESSISDIKTGGSEAQIKRLEKELARLNAIGGFEKLVPNEGLVFFYKGNTYKLTGTFAPLNQILGIFKFGR